MWVIVLEETKKFLIYIVQEEKKNYSYFESFYFYEPALTALMKRFKTKRSAFEKNKVHSYTRTFFYKWEHSNHALSSTQE